MAIMYFSTALRESFWNEETLLSLDVFIVQMRTLEDPVPELEYN